MSSGPLFNKSLSLSYLGLPNEYIPSPETDPIPFLTKHLTQLPPHLLLHFSYITSAKQRTVLPVIRNRRLEYVNGNPLDLHFSAASRKWSTLWPGLRRERWGLHEGAEEKAWAESDFLGGSTTHVGKLGGLLGGYEEEREAQRTRTLRRERGAAEQFIPEEDESSDEEDEPIDDAVEEESPDEAKASFERTIRERLIYGLLENFDYDKVDWDESLDRDDEREAENRWFDNDDE